MIYIFNLTRGDDASRFKVDIDNVESWFPITMDGLPVAYSHT